MKINRDYDTQNYSLDIAWYSDGDVDLILEFTVDSIFGLHKINDERWKYVAATKAEALAHEKDLIEKYYKFTQETLTEMSKDYSKRKKELEKEYKDNLREAKFQYEESLDNAKTDYDGAVTQIKEDYTDAITDLKTEYEENLKELEDEHKEEIEPFKQHNDEPVIKTLIREKKLNRIS